MTIYDEEQKRKPAPAIQWPVDANALWQAFLGGYACGMDHDYSGPPFEDAAREAWEQERGSHPAPEPGELERLRAENERLWEDAERYRALRDGSLDDLAVVRGLGVADYGLNVVLYTYLKEIEGDEMDNAIDAARRALTGGQEDG